MNHSSSDALAGTTLGFVSAQLGQADVGITARHYAERIESDHHSEPLHLEPGEVPADFLSRLPGSPQTSPIFRREARR